MGKGAAIGIGIFVLLILIGGLFYYSYTQLSVELNSASLYSIDWASFSWSTLLKLGLNALSGNWLGAAFDLIDGVNVNLGFALYNGGLLSVYIPDLSYDLKVNDIYVGNGFSKVDMTINPGQTKQIYSLQNFQKDNLNPAIYSIVNNGGRMELTVSGTAHFSLFGIAIPIPFESSKQISVYDEIRQRLNEEIEENKLREVRALEQSLQKAANSIIDEITGANTPDLNLNLQGQIIYDSTYKIGPGSYHYFPLSLPDVCTIQGGFIAHAGLGDNILAYLVDEKDFKLFQNDNEFKSYYSSGKVESDTFDVVLNPGEYYVILSNTHSSFSTKTVQLQVSGFC